MSSELTEHSSEKIENFSKYLVLTNFDWRNNNKDSKLYFVGLDEIKELRLYPFCPVCGDPVVCRVSKHGIFFGCPNHFFGDEEFGYLSEEARKLAADAWNSFVCEKFVNKYAKIWISVSALIFGAAMFLVDSLSIGLVLLGVNFSLMTVNFRKLAYKKMDKDIERFSTLSNSKEVTFSEDISFEEKSNCEILKVMRSEILDIMDMVNNAEFKMNSILICDIVRKAIIYLEENPNYNGQAENLVRRMEQFREVIGIYLKTDRYGGNPKILEQANQAIIELKPVFSELYRNLMEMQEFSSMATLKVLRQDIKEFSDWSGIGRENKDF